MEEICILSFIICVVTFVIFAWDKRRAHYGRKPLPAIVLFLLAILAPFGALCSMLMFKNRLKQPLFIIGVPLLLIAQIVLCFLLPIPRHILW